MQAGENQHSATHPLTNQKTKCLLSLSSLKPLESSPPLGKGSMGYHGEGWIKKESNVQ